jgi:hypothetical protein
MAAVNDTSFEDEFERGASWRNPHNRGALLRISTGPSIRARSALFTPNRVLFGDQIMFPGLDGACDQLKDRLFGF